MSASAPEPAPWAMYVRNRDLRAFSYRLTYRGDGRPDLVGAWVTTDNQQVDVVNPLPGSLLSLEIGAVVAWANVGRVLIDVSYDDPANAIAYRQSFEFTEHDDSPKEFSIDRRDPSVDWVSFDATILYTDGHQYVVPHSRTRQQHLFVMENMLGHELVTVQTDGVDFAAKGVSSVSVALRYEDPSAGLSYADTVTLNGPDARGSFEFDYADAQRRAYTWQATYSYVNGMSVQADPVTGAVGPLRVPLV